MRYLLLIGLFSLLLSILWFQSGLIMGTGESGLPFYNIQRQFELSNTSWFDVFLGTERGISTAAVTLYWFLIRLLDFGISPFLSQGLLFGLLFLVAGVGTYLLTREFFPNLAVEYLLISTLIYWFNPLTLVVVWNRFLYNFMVFWALLPLALFLFIKGVKRGDYRFAVLTSLATVVFSYALTSTVFNILLWGLFLYTSVFFLFFEPKIRRFITKYFFLTLSVFILFNFWWIGQLLSFLVSPAFDVTVSAFFTPVANLATLSSLSQRIGQLVDTSRLVHSTFFSDGPAWAQIYSFPLLVILEFLLTGLIFWTIYKFRKTKEVLFFGILFIGSLFLMKGNNPPLGEVFEQVFIKISYLQVFRNPFEKFGFLLSLSAAPLFAFGLQKIVDLQKSERAKKSIFGGALGFVVLIWGFPFWTGLVFTSIDNQGNPRSYEVKVPDYYEEANNWLKEQGGIFRFISLPLGGEGITYTWEKPYSGVELSAILFDIPNISFNTTIPYYHKVVNEIDRLFLRKGDIGKVMNALNSRFVITRSDVAWRERGMRDPAITRRILAEDDRLEHKINLGALSIWENRQWQDNTISVSNQLVEVKPQARITDLTLIGSSEPAVTSQGHFGYKKRANVLHPSYRFYIHRIHPEGFEERQDIFPFARFLPHTPLFNFVLLKERLELLFLNDMEKIAEKQILLLGKRISEVESELSLNHPRGVFRALFLYRAQLTRFAELIPTLNKRVLEEEGRAWRQGDLHYIFTRHRNALQEMARKTQDDQIMKEVEQTGNYLENVLSSLGVSPEFEYISNKTMEVKDRYTFQFEVDEPGQYNLLLNIKNWPTYHLLEDRNKYNLTFQIDNKVTTMGGDVLENGLVAFGDLELSSGIHEIGWNSPTPVNLVRNSEEELIFSTDHGVVEKRFAIENFDPYASYTIKLDYWVRMGSGLEVAVEYDNGPTKAGKAIPGFLRTVSHDNYFYDWHTFSIAVTPNRFASDGSLVLRVRPWNNCEGVYWSLGREKCEDEDFRSKYDRRTEVLVKNISVYRNMSEEPLLINFSDHKLTRSLPRLNYEKLDPTEYKLQVSDAKEPYLLVFSELFNSGWEARFKDGTKIPEEKHFLANAYANGWLIDRAGDYEMTLKFAPQEFLDKGKRISAISILGGLLFLGVSTWRRREY